MGSVAMDVEKKHGMGNHLIIEGFECNNEKINDENLIKNVLEELVQKLNLFRLSEPVVVRAEPRGTDPGGVTGMVLVSQSHISIHTYPEKKWLAMDLFSCKEFDPKQVLDYVKERFEIKEIHDRIIERGEYGISDLELDDVKGFDPTENIGTKDLVRKMETIGFQATHLARAAKTIKKMRNDKATIFFGFTSNMVSSGLREVFASLVKNKMIDVIVTTVGSIEEDLMKCEKPFLLGSFDVSDIDLHRKGINRIGNVFVPNDRYVHLEKVIQPFLGKMLELQKEKGKLLAPSEIIHELGKIVDDENSILYWATKNNIPVYCPAITDGAFGLQTYFFKQDHDEFGIDVTADMKDLANTVFSAEKAGGIILGGSVPKHHIIGLNLMRDGLDYAVYVSTGTEGDGSLSGARTKEGVSWGKIKEDANHVFVEGDATIIFPLLAISMSETE
jgi:deoxyhypusine synthase